MSTEQPAYAIVQISGADADDFLRAQLTRDVHRLNVDHHALAAWCDAKGRALCTLRVLATDVGYLLILPATVAEAIRKRLHMFVLRANVEIVDVTSAWTLAATLCTARATSTLPANGHVARVDRSYLLGLNTGHGPGALWLLPTGHADATLSPSDDAWQLAEIDAGLPEISAPTSGLFVPQMLNLHWLDAIDFDKGCYPGQEVIARLQYRGRLKRRLFRMHWRGSQPAPGDAINDADDKTQGTVVRAAQTATDEGRLLAVIRVQAADESLTSAQTRLAMLDLPYTTEQATPV